MQCADVTEWLLDDDRASDPDVDRHVAGCARCAHVAQRLNRLDAVLGATLLVMPPLELEQQLARLVLESTRPVRAAAPWWNRVLQWDPSGWLALRPQVIAAQGLAAVMLALASWQLFGWMTAFQPVVGDVGYAMQLVAASPAVVSLSGLQIDLQGLGLWSLVGIGGWLMSDDGLIGRQLTLRRQRLP